ncbi:hypothetical protein [Corynebacterium silvaticum]|uniref:Uncharacterized protein n=1 Tax=Corynebacterium silvaticum TaxID=2320431 RepID=A0ACD4PYA2_9CORY|nr:hypothetical protein [Corynebacterium silvaticum]MBH5299828.1 hypothetical protein [Corynebacterium silvaticum]NOM65724.1 hypothetical protein [Corynebacterium silvaticum]NON71183.1 hypothetical protein [Corynebacterium silvaticum]TFA91541.1 hypothetical protein EU802_10240 [Corynebacterium silvaticum]TFA92597.1 hypothetical protein EU799_10750 [Corynebacterium silvaticum]
MKLTTPSKTSAKRTAIALTCAFATAASTLVAAPAASAATRLEGQCAGIDYSLTSVTPSWSSFQQAKVGDTITYQMKISNVSFQKGAAILGVAATVPPDVDGVYAENGQVKFVHSLGKNPELFNQGESVTASHTHALTAADIEKSSVDKN